MSTPMVFYTANCIKCPFIASARAPQRAIDGLIDHLDAVHPAVALTPVLDGEPAKPETLQ